MGPPAHTIICVLGISRPHLECAKWAAKEKKKRDYLQSYNTLKDFGLLLEDCFEDYIFAW
jgi:hypothetical protein